MSSIFLTSKQDILDIFYPVGTYYLSENDSNPGTFMGGTWIKLDENIVLMSSSSDKTTNTNEFTVSEDNISQITKSHSHDLNSTNASDDVADSQVSGMNHTKAYGVGTRCRLTNPPGMYWATKDYHNNQLVRDTDVKIGKESPDAIKLSNIIKRPKLFIFKRTA